MTKSILKKCPVCRGYGHHSDFGSEHAPVYGLHCDRCSGTGIDQILTPEDRVALARRVRALLFINAGTWGDMCAQDVPQEDIEAVISETEPPDLKQGIDEELERWNS